MSTLLIHFISDFLRDAAPTAGNFGEALRCKVLEDENTAMNAYGLSIQQKGVIRLRDRQKILKFLADEIGAVMDEVDGTLLGFGPAYPAGAIHLRAAAVLFTDATGLRTIRIRGSGMEPTSAVTFTPKAGGAVAAGTIVARTCDRDVWQRLHVTANLPAGDYVVTVTKPSNSPAGDGKIDLTVV
jgi:hypothetical protein